MVATNFTTATGLTADPGAYMPSQDIPAAPPEEFVETRRLVGEAVQTEQIWEPSEEERDQFATFLNVGKQTKTITVMGHKVGIESLNIDDNLRIGTFTKDYLGTEAYAEAVRVATCAAAIRTVDGRPLYLPFSQDESPESIFEARLELLKRAHTSIVMETYPHILNLDVKFAELAIKLGKLKG
jgi:hypothetical protein